MTDDIVARAKAALEGINTPMPWRFSPWQRGMGSSELTGACGVHMAWAIDDGDGTFIAQSPDLVAKLVGRITELECGLAAAEQQEDTERSWRKKAEAERDQLKATAEVDDWLETGDDQSGDPCCGDPTPRTFRGVAGEHSKCLSCGTLLDTTQSGDPS